MEVATGMTFDEVIDALQAASTIQTVPLDLMQVDPTYQRAPSTALVEKITEDYDRVSAELLLLSWRGEGKGYWIINGQHRSLAAKKRGLTEVDCRVIDTSHMEDPAEWEATFRLRTNVRMPDKPLERFKAQLRAGNEESLAIVGILEKFDTEVNDTQNPSTDYGINAIAAVEKLYRLDEGDLLIRTFQMIKEVYGIVGGKHSSASIMTGFAWYLTNQGEKSNYDRMVEKLKLAGLAALDRKARTIQADMAGPIWMNYYRAMVGFYNERLGGEKRLDWITKGAGSWRAKPSGWSGTSSGQSHAQL